MHLFHSIIPKMKYLYTHAVLGGTFDLLHIGHQDLITKAFEIGKFVTIGITTDKFNKLRGKPSWQEQNLRLNSLKRFLKEKDYLKRSKIVFIKDIFGTTLSDPKLEAIIVTEANKETVHLINKKRVKKGLRLLDIIFVPFAKDEMDKIISATRIRNGEISTLGQSYKNMLLKMVGKRLGEGIRNKLKKPLGQIITVDKIHPDNSYISVGDITTVSLLQKKFQPILSIVDLKVQRADVFHHLTSDVHVQNPPGQISKSLILAISKALKRNSPQIIMVNGEEDLATIPAILLSPLGTTVLYGQPKKGIVEVKVDLKIKDYLSQILSPISH